MAEIAEIMGWLNANQGAAIVVLTLVYVVATIIMVRVMIHSNRLTRQLEEQRSRPAVMFRIIQKEQWIQAILKNTGLTSAYDVKVTCTPSLIQSGPGKETAITAYPTSFLPPQETIIDLIDTGAQFFKKHPQPVFSGTVRYRDQTGKVYEEKFRIDLTVYLHLLYSMKVDVGGELQKISGILERLIPVFDAPLVRTIDDKEYRNEQIEQAKAINNRAQKVGKQDADGEEPAGEKTQHEGQGQV